MIKDYFSLTKPGIIYGNAITATAGFFLASHGTNGIINFLLLMETLLGLSLVIASGCVFNNYIDRNIDEKMARTKNRPIVTGKISGQSAIIYGILLGISGFFILALFTNFFAFSAASAGFIFYVVIYSLWKRLSVWSTIIGSVSGAVPPVVGYSAIAGTFDSAAIILFLILICWQMPHFYAIGIYRRSEYAAAEIPILPVKKSIALTKINILLFITAFAIISPLLFVFGYTGYRYLIIALILSVTWLGLGISGFKKTSDDNLWARRMFIFSLLVLVTLSITMALDAI